jgi:peptidyl-prolyl cis-trans isomerase C
VNRTAFAAFILAAACYAAPGWAAPETVVGKVNGRDITEAEINYAEAEIGSELAGVPAESRRRVLFEYLVEAHLMAEAAEKATLDEGKTFEGRMQYYRLRALRDTYFETQIRDSVPEAEAKALYDERVKSIPAEQEIRASHILVKTEDEAKNVVKELQAGGDFAELATKYSQDRGGAGGGDLGYFTRGQMVKPFEDAAFAMEKDKLSEPVETQHGWHIIKVDDKRERHPPSFEEVKDQITASLIQAKLQGTVRTLRSDAKIEIVDPVMKAAAEAEAPAEDKPEAAAEEGEKKTE